METIFDHNVTRKELAKLLGRAFENVTLSEVEKLNISQRVHYEKIYCLYLIRGDKEKASVYAAKMPNDARKLLNVCLHDFANN